MISIPLYKRVLGKQYVVLPKAVQQLHDYSNAISYEGKITAKRGGNFFCKILATLCFLPRSGEILPLRVTFVQEGDVEKWIREFGTQKFTTIQMQDGNKICEKLGPIKLLFTWSASTDALTLVLSRLLLFGVPFPRLLLPKIQAHETENDNAFALYLQVKLPYLGLLIEYSGWLGVAK